MESQPSGGLGCPVPACRLSSAPPRATASATSRLKLLGRDFFFFPMSISLSLSLFLFVKLQDDFLNSRGSEPATWRFYPAWHSFHFISDEDVELSQKGHKSGQLALAPRRSSSTSFSGLPSRIPPLKSEMSLHIALMAARRDAPKVHLMKYTWPAMLLDCGALAPRPRPRRPAGPCSEPAASSGQT